MTPLVRALRSKLGLDAGTVNPLQWLGEAGFGWLARGELDNSEAAFAALACIAERSPVGFIGVADVALARFDSRRAIEFCERALRAEFLDPETAAMALCRRAKAAMQLGEPDLARADFSDAVIIDPDGMIGREATQWMRQIDEMRARLRRESARDERERKEKR